MEYNVLIGGEAGQGMKTLTSVFSQMIHKRGFYLFTLADYMSRVRGGHNFFQLRFSDDKLYSHCEKLDVIIALNQETCDLHLGRLKEDGVVLADTNVKSNDSRLVTIKAKELATEVGNVRTMSTVLLGALLKLFGLDEEYLEEIFSHKFNEKITNQNLESYQRGQSLVEQKFKTSKGNKAERLLINGNQAIALGALAANMKFYSAYPMTPATSIMSYLVTKAEEAKIIVEQAEDEIAAINMAIGAASVGVRAMTGTSGGGFSLMVEGLGLAGIAEIPLVIALVQRPGPATGLPTRTEQADLKFAINASQGEFGRIVISLNSPEDAFYQTTRAFNLAEKYQLPVILLSDQYLADATQTVNLFDLDKVAIERSIEDEPSSDYKRYALSETGISPRALPGYHSGVVINHDSDEHDEEGNITESAQVRNDMVNKRAMKFSLAKNDIQEPKVLGIENPQILLLGWGSTYSQLKDAVELLNENERRYGALVFGDIWPLPTKKFLDSYKTSEKIINVEQNSTAQLASLIKETTGKDIDLNILRYDGRPLSADEIIEKVLEVE